MTTTSKHYQSRVHRNRKIEEVGFGNIVYTVKFYHQRYHKYNWYDITDKGIIRVRDIVKTDYIVTEFFARPKVILRFWPDCPNEILAKARENQTKGYNNICN